MESPTGRTDTTLDLSRLAKRGEGERFEWEEDGGLYWVDGGGGCGAA